MHIFFFSGRFARFSGFPASQSYNCIMGRRVGIARATLALQAEQVAVTQLKETDTAQTYPLGIQRLTPKLEAAKSILCLSTDCKTMPSKPDLSLIGIFTPYSTFKTGCKENHSVYCAVPSVPGGLTNSPTYLESCLVPMFLINFSFTFKFA